MKKMNNCHNSKHFLNVLLLLLMLVGIDTSVWGVSTATLSAKSNSVQKDGITFSLSGSYIINNPLVDYTYTGSGNEATLSWAAPQGYSINVSQITINAKNARSWGTTGKGQYKTSKNSSYTQFCNKNSFTTYTLNSSSYFGLGDNGSITIKAVDKELQYKDIVFTYTKTAHKYTIAFNGNGNTSGSTASVNATYDVNASLTTNGFVKTKYTVNFNADGGSCGTSSTQINYSFAGWAKTSAGSVEYANGATVKNLTATNNATVTLYAKWNNPASETITLPNAAKDGYVLEGWYDGSTKVGEAGNSYTVTKDVTLIAHWTQRFDFTMSGANTTLSVGEQQATAFNFVHASNPTPHITVKSIDPINNGNGKVIEYDAANNTIIAHNAGTATIYFTQAETSTIKSGTSATYTYTVTKLTTSFSGSAYNLMVDGTQTANYSYTNTSAAQPTANSNDNFYYTIDEVSFTNEALNNGTNLVTFNPSNKQITACNAGTAKITFHQKETYKYTGATTSFNVTVKKYPNSISCSWETWSKTLNFNQETNVVFSAKNTDVPIVVTQKTGKTVATYHSAPRNTIRTSYSVGEATWSVSQAENYKYLAPETKTVTVNVNTVASECSVLDEPAEKSIGKYGDAEHKQYQTYSWTEEGAVLKFKMWKLSGANDIGNHVTLYDGAGVKIGNDYDYSIGSMSTSPVEYTITLPAGVRSVKFRNGTGAWEGASTLNTYISHVKVTRSTWLNLQNNESEEIDSLEMPVLLINNASTNADFYINYSTCADEIKVVSNHPHIEVSEGSFESSTSGTKQITITYSSTVLEDINATITVYTPSENKTLAIHAQTVKQPQTIIWSAGYEDASVSLPVGLTEADPATASSGLDPVLYSTNNPSVIQIADDGQSFSVIGEGTATLTASQAGDDALWDPVSSSKTINATDKKIQLIHWEQDFTRSIAPGDVKSLLAEVYINNPLAGVQTKDDARTALIHYSCPTGNDVISVAGNQMTVLGYGITSVTATIEGDEDYEEASVTLLVRVREPSAGCETPFVLDHTEQVQLFSMDIEWGEWTTPQITSEPILIDKSKGKPDKLSFMHEGEEYAIPVFSNIKVYRGPIKVQERVNGDWSDVEGSQVTPTKYEWNQLSNLQLNENADAIRFVRLVEGQGYHNIKNIQISLLPYLREEEETINLGNIQAGAVWPSAIGFDYSDVKHNLSVSKSGADGSFLQMDETIEMDCGAHGHYDFPITFAPTHIGDWTNDVTITDPITSKSITVHLTAHVIQGSQSIVWNVAKTTYAVTEPINVLTATATSGLPVSYTITAGNDVASIVGDEVIVSKPGTFTIQASQAGDVNFKAADPVSKTFTIAVSEYVFTNHDGNSDWNTTGNWLAGTKPGNNEDVIIRGNLIINNNVEVHNLTIEGTGSVTMVENGTLTINGTSKDAENYGNLYVQNGGEVDVVGTLKVRDLTVEASIGTSDGTAESGQVVKAEHITYANAYIEIHMDPADVMDDTKWYGFTVPFAVNAHNGVSRKEGDVYRNCVYGSHYMIAEYDAAKRLTSGKGWKYLSGNTLNPGQFYFFTVNGNYNTYRFKASEASYTPAAAASLAMNGAVENANANWNGVGNSTLRHATASYAGGSYVQVYENGLDAYKTVATSEATFVVGCPFFIQAKEASTLVLEVQSGESEQYYAPRRTSANQTGVARVNLTSVDGGFSDQIYVSATDREQDCYLAGHDLSKAGESKIVPQLWIDAYNQKLSVHELAWQGDEASCAISLYAPQAGEYILTAKQPTDGTEVYLTYNGQVLWNLTFSEYVLSLEKGTTTAYGLQIVKTPAITTGVDQIDVKGQTVRKVLMNDKIYVITPEGAMYDVLGKGVKF